MTLSRSLLSSSLLAAALTAAPAVALGVEYSAAPVQTVAATDPSAQYRHLPGFRCNYFSPKTGECMDFSYDNTAIQSPYHPVAPSYRSNSSYGTRRYDDRSYDRHYDDPYYYDRSGRRSSSRDRLILRVTDFPPEVEEGDTITYRIFLRNDSPYERRTKVLAMLDPDTEFLSASHGGRDRYNSSDRYRSSRYGEEVEWDDVFVRANDSVTLELRVRVDGNVRDGDKLTLDVEADDEEASAITTVEDRFDDRYEDDCDYYYRDSRSSSRRYYDDPYYDRYCRDSRYGRSRSSGRERVRLSVSDSPDPVRRDELLTYSIDVRNDESYGQYIDVRAFLDPDTYFYSASDRGEIDRGGRRDEEVLWEEIYIERNATKRLTLTVRVDSRASTGRDLRLDIEAGDDDTDITTRVQ